MAIAPSSRLERLLTGIAALLLLALFASRFWDLSSKPYHHDESLYANESFKFATKGFYNFHPMLHGPFLFHVQALLFLIFPPNDFTGRLPVALAGIAVAFFGVLFFRRRFTSPESLTWLALVTLSPSLCYFSRFLGMDLPMVALGVGWIYFSIRCWETRDVRFLYASVAALSCMVCLKLNFLFYGFSVATFFYAALQLKKDEDPSPFPDAGEIRALARQWKWHLLGAAGLFILIFCALYSSLGTNPKGILDGLYKEMIPYWVKQHRQQRIKGPFDYYWGFFLVYELPMVLLLVASVIRAMRANAKTLDLAIRTVTAALTVYLVAKWQWTYLATFFARFHLESPWHIFLLLIELGSWLVVVKHHVRKTEYLSAFFFHWGLTSLLLYSYAGEKIPWLTTHIIVPFFLYGATVLPRWWATSSPRSFTRAAMISAAALLIPWQAWITFQSSHLRSADPHERLVYTHTSWEIVDLVSKIHHLGHVTRQETNFDLQITGLASWPMAWYLRDYKRWFRTEVIPADRSALYIVDWDKRDTFTDLMKGYSLERFKLREWWVPDPLKATFGNELRYFLTRDVYSILGSQDIAVFVREDLLEPFRAANRFTSM